MKEVKTMQIKPKRNKTKSLKQKKKMKRKPSKHVTLPKRSPSLTSTPSSASGRRVRSASRWDHPSVTALITIFQVKRIEGNDKITKNKQERKRDFLE